MIWRALVLLILALCPATAFAQSQAVGKFTPGHALRAINPQGTDYGDAGGAGGSATPGAGYLTELGITAPGAPLCINDALTNNPGGYHRLCLGANSLGGGLLSYDAIGGASPLPLQCEVNGALTPCVNTPIGGGTSTYGVDVKSYGATCGATVDATSAVQAAVNATVAAGGGNVFISCPILIAGQVTLGANVRLAGVGAVYYPGMLDESPTGLVVPATWPPTSGPDISCTNVTMACFLVNAIGVEIDHINFGNPQPTPPTTCPVAPAVCNTWTPTVFPYIIATSAAANWNGLHIHDDTFTSASQCIDLEGTPNYNTAGIAGAQWTIENLWFNPCLNTGIRFHNEDNTGRVDNVDMDFWYGRNLGPVGWYMENNSIGFDIEYLANSQFNNIEFLYNKVAMQFINSTVSGGFGSTFAATKLQMTNIGFNLPCQGMSIPSGNGTFTDGTMTNIVIGQDNTYCPPQNAFFDLSSDTAHWTFAHTHSDAVQTLLAIGHGTSGIAIVNDVDIQGGYSAYHVGGPAFKESANSSLTLIADTPGIRPALSCGTNCPLEGPGVDGTQGYMRPFCMGGGTNAAEGAACLQGSSDPTHTGMMVLYSPARVRTAEFGFGLGNQALVNFDSPGGNFQVVNGGITPGIEPVANLPVCNTSTKNQIYIADDVAGTPTYLSNVTTGGGSSYVLVVCNGVNWQAH